jgi:hypothetical protein
MTPAQNYVQLAPTAVGVLHRDLLSNGNFLWLIYLRPTEAQAGLRSVLAQDLQVHQDVLTSFQAHSLNVYAS